VYIYILCRAIIWRRNQRGPVVRRTLDSFHCILATLWIGWIEEKLLKRILFQKSILIVWRIRDVARRKKIVYKKSGVYTDLELEYRRQQFPYVPYSDQPFGPAGCQHERVKLVPRTAQYLCLVCIYFDARPQRWRTVPDVQHPIAFKYIHIICIV